MFSLAAKLAASASGFTWPSPFLGVKGVGVNPGGVTPGEGFLVHRPVLSSLWYPPAHELPLLPMGGRAKPALFGEGSLEAMGDAHGLAMGETCLDLISGIPTMFPLVSVHSRFRASNGSTSSSGASRDSIRDNMGLGPPALRAGLPECGQLISCSALTLYLFSSAFMPAVFTFGFWCLCWNSR